MTLPAWFTLLRPGSYRGEVFYTASSEFEGGRRGSVLEFPRQSDPKTQDLGLAARRFMVEAFVIGSPQGEDGTYQALRDRLIAALEKGGPGKLVHRYHGEMQAEVEPGKTFRVSESPEFGGSAKFSIPFIRVPEKQNGPTVIDGPALVLKAANKSKEFSISAFTKKFFVDGPEFIREHAMTALTFGVNQVQDVNNQVTGALGGINQVNQTIKSFSGSLATLIATPGMLMDLGRGGFGLHEAIFASIGVIANAFKTDIEAFTRDPKTVAREESRKVATVTTLGLKLGAATGNDMAPVVVLGSRSTQMAQNQAAVFNLFQQSAVIEAARASLDLSFESNAAALAMRDSLVEALVVQAQQCDDDDVFGSLQDLRAEVSRYLTVVAGTAPRQRDFLVRSTTPAILLAHLAHGDASRAEEIISRNGMRHPGFVPGGYAIKVIDV